MKMLTEKQRYILEHDLEHCMTHLTDIIVDDKPYDPCCADFMRAMNIMLMLHLDKKMKHAVGEEEHDSMHAANMSDYSEELSDSEKYEELWRKTNDERYKEMAEDELKHARYLMEINSGKHMAMTHTSAIVPVPDRKGA